MSERKSITVGIIIASELDCGYSCGECGQLRKALVLIGRRLDENICLYEKLNKYDSMIIFFFAEILNSITTTVSFFPLSVLLKSSLYCTLLGNESDFSESPPIIFTTVNFSWCLLAWSQLCNLDSLNQVIYFSVPNSKWVEVAIV